MPVVKAGRWRPAKANIRADRDDEGPIIDAEVVDEKKGLSNSLIRQRADHSAPFVASGSPPWHVVFAEVPNHIVRVITPRGSGFTGFVFYK